MSTPASEPTATLTDCGGAAARSGVDAPDGERLWPRCTLGVGSVRPLPPSSVHSVSRSTHRSPDKVAAACIAYPHRGG